MKYTKESTTKTGRRTWRTTYELVSGPEPKGKRPKKAPSAKGSTPPRPPRGRTGAKRQRTRGAKATRQAQSLKKRRSRLKKRVPAAKGQLGLF